VLVQLLDNLGRWDTDGGDEELRAGFDDYVDKLIKLALGVVVAVQYLSAAACAINSNEWHPLCFPCAATDLWEQKIDAKWSVLILQEALELGNLLSQHVWGISDTSDDTKTTGICDGCGELRASSDVHTGEEDRVVDLQEIRRDGAYLLCRNALLALLPCCWSTRSA
jgi:hypothetical protein